MFVLIVHFSQDTKVYPFVWHVGNLRVFIFSYHVVQFSTVSSIISVGCKIKGAEHLPTRKIHEIEKKPEILSSWGERQKFC